MTGPPSMMRSASHRQLVEEPALVAGLTSRAASWRGLLGQRWPTARAGRGRRLPSALRREHPDHPDVAAERDGLDAVLGLAAPARPQRGAEADQVLGAPSRRTSWPARGARPRAARSRRPRRATKTSTPTRYIRAVPSRRESPDFRRTGARHQFPGALARPARPRRALRRDRGRVRGRRARRRPLDGVDDVEEPDPAGEEGCDALLVRRVVDGRIRRRRSLADPARQPDRGERLVVERLERPAASRRPAAAAAPRPAPGRASRARGRSAAACRAASTARCVEPSANSTIEWTIDCGCTHDVDRGRAGCRRAGAPR